MVRQEIAEAIGVADEQWMKHDSCHKAQTDVLRGSHPPFWEGKPGQRPTIRDIHSHFQRSRSPLEQTANFAG